MHVYIEYPFKIIIYIYIYKGFYIDHNQIWTDFHQNSYLKSSLYVQCAVNLGIIS
jgi:hypothetical protein